MKIIFLDVDGELTYSNFENNETANIDIGKVKLLKEICDRTEAKVVISSSWKGYDDWKPPFYRVLREILDNNGVEVLGDTPHIPPKFDEDIDESVANTTLEDLPCLKVKHGTGRAAEVQKWIQDHDVEQSPV